MNKNLIACAAMMFCGAAGAQVFRCDIAGQVLYTDAPCHAGAVRPVEIRGNTVATEARSARRRPPSQAGTVAPVAAVEPPPQASSRPPLPPGSCPSDTDIKNIHTRLSASVIPARNRAALHSELAKAQRCPERGRRYSWEEWKRLEGVLRGDE